MVNETSKRKRNRPRKHKLEVEVVPKEKQNYRWILLIAIGMGLIGVIVGQVADTKTAMTLGIIGFVLGSFGGAVIFLGDKLPARKGTEQASQNYQGGNKMPNVEDIFKK